MCVLSHVRLQAPGNFREARAAALSPEVEDANELRLLLVRSRTFNAISSSCGFGCDTPALREPAQSSGAHTVWSRYGGRLRTLRAHHAPLREAPLRHPRSGSRWLACSSG